MVFATWWFFGIAVAAEVRAYDGKLACQRRRDLEPRQVRERISVHQQHRRPAAADNSDNARAAGLDLGSFEAVEHGTTCVVVMARSIPVAHAFGYLVEDVDARHE